MTGEVRMFRHGRSAAVSGQHGDPVHCGKYRHFAIGRGFAEAGKQDFLLRSKATEDNPEGGSGLALAGSGDDKYAGLASH